MAHKLKVDYPDLPKGEELTMTGLPVMLVNGSTVDVSAEDEAAFKESQGRSLSEALKGNPYLKLSTASKGGDS